MTLATRSAAGISGPMAKSKTEWELFALCCCGLMTYAELKVSLHACAVPCCAVLCLWDLVVDFPV